MDQDPDQCRQLIDQLLNENDGPEKLVESFRRIVDKYQEQPELLEPYLQELIHRLTSSINNLDRSSTKYHTVFKFLYQLTKVVGFKSIGKRFPHEPDKLPLLVELLENEDPKERINWQTRFVLTVWLSIVILAPFDLVKFDSDPSSPKTCERIYSALVRNLENHDSCQHVTAFCLAKFFSRPDMLQWSQLDEFIKVVLDDLENIKPGAVSSTDDIKLIGYLRTLAYMFKFLPRDELKQRSGKILDTIASIKLDNLNRELINHLLIKLTQRVALALLPKRVATWRCKRGSRILGGNESSSTTMMTATATATATATTSQDGSEEEISSMDRLESILNILFVAVQNSHTKIRLSAAKGIARVANRLSRERASEVIDMVVGNFFESTSSEYAWHGGCLTLAEMSRQGLILEEKLSVVTKIVGDAIIYDRIKGSFPVGSHVRESACYVFWAMARTYDDATLKPFIPSISTNLLCTMLFDRELQCRRAASATFQELVGRQGAYNQEGISILTSVDYQSVGSRPFAYLELALQVARFGQKYYEPFIRHLLDKKLGHWDVQIRRLASDSLGALMLNPSHDFVRLEVLPRLCQMCDVSDDNNVKHGAILGLAKVIRSLMPLDFKFDQELVDFVGQLGKKCEKPLKSKQHSANFIEALANLILNAEVAKFRYDEEILKQWESISLTALDSDNADLRDIGSEALLTLYKFFYSDNKTCQDRLLTILNKSLNSANESSRCGGLRALSKLGATVSGGGPFNNGIGTTSVPGTGTGGESKIKRDADTPDIILITLASYIAKQTREKPEDLVFAAAKAEACEALVNFVKSLDKSRLVVSTQLLRPGFDALLEKSEDYTFDKRGDIGVVVRRAAIKSLQELTLYLMSIGMNSILLESNRIGKIIARILQQAVSYNNSAREQAGLAFYRLISALAAPESSTTNSISLPDDAIPHKAEILSLFEKYNVNDEFNWRDDSTPIFVNLLAKQEYSSDLWIGLMPAVGQASDLCAKQFRDSLADYITSLKRDSPKDLELVFESFLQTIERPDLVQRLLTSGLIVAEYLLTQGLLLDTNESFQARLAQLCWQSRTNNDPKRLIWIIRVLSSMLQFSGAVQRDCLKYCLTMLVNGFSKVRVYTAEQLYLSIMTYQSDLEANHATGDQSERQDLERAMELLRQTKWDEPLEKVKPVCEEICSCLKV